MWTLNFIPMAMVDHVEVLTDGAAAQYGSDAIAGVINFILKERTTSGGSVNATYGGFFDGGGSTTEVDANAGFAPIENSFFNITAQVSNHGHTDRGNPDPRTDPAYYAGSYPNSNIALVPGYPDINQYPGRCRNPLQARGLQRRCRPPRRRPALQQRHLRHQGLRSPGRTIAFPPR